MNLSALFIRRPVMTTLVMVAILMFGILGFRQLPINDLPQVDYPTIAVSASLPGASPETMATTVATVLERQFATIAGLDNISSSSSLGATRIILQFSLSRDIDAAAQDVQTAISAALSVLPPMPTRPSFKKVNPADAPILYLSLSSATQPLSAVDEYAETLVGQRISMVNGVAQVNVYGSQIYAVRAQVDPRRLASLGVGIDEVASAMKSGSIKEPTGTLYGPHTIYNVQSNDQLMNANAFRPLIVKVRNGVPIRLTDVGQVIDSVQNDKVANWTRVGRAIVLAVSRQPGTNTVQVIDDIKATFPALQAQIPASVQLSVLFDRSTSIRDSVRDVEITLGVTVLLVVMVIFLFLRNATATLIPSLSLPMSLIGTFAAMALLNFSLNNLSLMALTLCVGFVIDDAIVVLENVVRHMEKGEDAFTATLRGTGEVSFTIVSMTLSLVAVFIPILFMSGYLGRLFSEFAITITCAILISGFVALTLIPMLCSRFLKPSSGPHGFVYNWLENIFDQMLYLYDLCLRVVLRFRLIALLVSFGLLFLTYYLFMNCSKGFIPTTDTGQINIATQAAQDISFKAMVKHQKELEAIIAADPNVQDYMNAVGAGGASNTGNAGTMFISLKPRDKRALTADQVIQELRRKFSRIVGIGAFMQNPPAIRIGGMTTKGMYQFTIQSLDLPTLYKADDILLEKIKTVPGVQDPNTDLQIQSLQAQIHIDRDKASALGLTAKQLDSALVDAYGTAQLGQIYTATNEYWYILEVQPHFYGDPNLMKQLYIRSPNGPLVPLSAVASFGTGVGPLLVNHLGELPAATISFNLVPGYSLGDVEEQIAEVARNAGLPAGVTTSFQGQAQAFQDSLRSLMMLLIVAILVIYIVLGILYESFAHPITILSGLPSAGIGAIATLMLFRFPLDIYGFLGLIMLIGIVKKNAIMMVDHAIEVEREHKKPPVEAIREACLVRFRPIMMTTVAAIMGSFPIALGLGAGGETRQPLGLAVVGGLLVSQCLTLFITPVVYLYIDAASQWFGRGANVAPRAQVWLEGKS